MGEGDGYQQKVALEEARGVAEQDTAPGSCLSASESLNYRSGCGRG